MTFILRDYQQECVDAVLQASAKRQLIQLPTGAGKTVILWHILKQLNVNSVLVAPTTELTEQLEETGREIVGQRIYRKSRSFWPAPENYDHLILTVQATTWAQKDKHLDAYNPKVLVIDEAHRSRSKTLENLIEWANARNMLVIGATATPERLDGKSLIPMYEQITYSCVLQDLIKQGHLCDILCYKVETKIKPQKMKYQNGDISPRTLNELDSQSRNNLIVKLMRENIPDKKSLVFCLSVDHAKTIARQLNDSGIPAAAIYGALPRSRRKAILKAFKEGAIQALCNCQLLTEGFDEPSIQALVLARPTKSKALFSQMIGRGVRPHENKTHCIAYDFSDEIHNIASFNLLGADGGQLEWAQGKKLSEMPPVEKKKVDLDYQLNEYQLYEKDYYKQLAFFYQLKQLKENRIPHTHKITMLQAAYLLFKNRKLKEHGYNTRNYWKKWDNMAGYDTR